MPSNTTPFRTWATSKGFFSETESKALDSATPEETELLALCAKLVPSEHSNTLFYNLRKALEFASDHGLKDFGPLRHVTLDKRFPATLRLAASLALGDTEQTKALSKSVGALAKLGGSGIFYSSPVSLEAFNVLSVADRFRLLDGGVSPKGTTMTTDEVIAVLKEAQSKSWRPYYQTFIDGVSWDSNPVTALTKLNIIASLAKFKPNHTLSVAFCVLERADRSGLSAEDLRLALDMVASLMVKVDSEKWPRHNMNSAKSFDVATLLLAPEASRESQYMHLAALFAAPGMPLSLMQELVHPDSFWVLEEVLKGASSLELLKTLELFPKRLSDDLAGFGVINLLGKADLAWLADPDAEKIYHSLPLYAGRTLLTAIETIADCPQGSAPSADFKLIPNWALEVITDGLMHIKPIYDPARLGAAQAYLISQGYSPSTTSPLPVYDWNADYTKLDVEFIYEALSKILFELEKGTASDASLSVARAWIKRMSVNEIAELITFSFNAENPHAVQEMPPVIAETLEEALSLCESDTARNALVSKLDNPPAAREPKMTLSTFAKEVSNTIKNMKA